MNTTYELVTVNGCPGIRCNLCGRISYNPNDIEQRYCGACHLWHTTSNVLIITNLTLGSCRHQIINLESGACGVKSCVNEHQRE